MSLNPDTRTETVEVKLNLREVSRLDNIRGGLGRSPYFRALLDEADRRHGMPPAPPKESRGCRGQGRPASRASATLSMRRHF